MKNLGVGAVEKLEIALGKPTNQNFVSIPHSRSIQMLEYRVWLAGINVIVQGRILHIAGELRGSYNLSLSTGKQKKSLCLLVSVQVRFVQNIGRSIN